MTIDEAIKHLGELSGITHYYHRASMKEALSLGIGALKRLRDARVSGYYGLDEALLGETRDY